MYKVQSHTTEIDVADIDFSTGGSRCVTDGAEYSLTITFDVTAESTGEVTVTEAGVIRTTFAGTQLPLHEEDPYIHHAVCVWRAVTGDQETIFDLRQLPGR